MWPVLLKVGDWSFYSLGFFLFLGFFLASFAIWKQARSAGLSEEKVFDTLFLTTFLSLVIGRISYVLVNWATFASDPARIVLVLKYPGFLLPATIMAVIAVSGLLAWNFALPVLWLWDIFAIAAGFFAIFASLGCFLDGCFTPVPYLPVGLAVLALVFVAGSLFLERKLASVVSLAEVARRRGIFFLCYLIFQLVSLLMASGWSGYLWREVVYIVALILVIGAFGIRYKELFIYVYRAISRQRFGTN